MGTVLPDKLTPGDNVRVIAPSRSMNLLSETTIQLATQRLNDLGLAVSFGAHVLDIDMCGSASISGRLQDLHDAFADERVKMVLTVIGGFNANQLLDDIDYDLIRSNPKIVCGYSDITALTCAIYARTGLVTYSGPHYSTFGMKKGIDHTIDSFRRAFFDDNYLIEPPADWSDDAWYEDQENRVFHQNHGFDVVHEGRVSGIGIGGNLCTLNLLQGTRFMPSLQESILFIEDDSLTFLAEFDRDLESLTQLPDFQGVQGILIGRFQEASEISLDDVRAVIERKKKLANIPILANVTFGHTTPHCVLPVGRRITFDTDKQRIEVGE
jgi:muramoyltetrapeptide carboxypeptidase LdcA involved in peptidoglycan recycling